VGVTIKGLSSLQAKLRNLDPLTRNAVARGVQLAAIKVEGDAKMLAPEDTGALRRSITTNSRSTANGAEASIGSSLEYAAYQELGTSRNQAQPFLKPALQKNKKAIKTIIITEIVKAHKGI
jgi:HK97 gp10 family phage protein